MSVLRVSVYDGSHAFDRYFAIVRNKSMLKRRNVKIILCSLWFISAVGFMRRLARKGVTKQRLENGEFNVCLRVDSGILHDKSWKYLSFSMLMYGVLNKLS